MMTIAQRNRRVGLLLTLIALGMFVYSFLIVRRRGQQPEPKNLTPLQKILRGL